MRTTTNPASHTPTFVWDRSGVPEQWEDESFVNGQTRGSTVDRSLLEDFIYIPDHSSTSNYEFTTFEGIFHSNALENINQGKYEGTNGLTAWIHDRNSDSYQCRSYNGAMSTEGFDRVLRRKRFSEPNEVDAHTRRIYLPNPHPTILGVLALRSSQQQTPMIRKIIYRHLKADASLSVEFGLGGRTFAFEASIPFFVVKRSKIVMRDARTTSSGSQIRKTHDLSFLSKSYTWSKDEGASDALHECHISMFITGWNVNFWTAVCLNDTYYYDDDILGYNEDMLRHYDNRGPPDESTPPLDPLSIGNLTADAISPNDPRDYFLLILKHRTQKT
ncbi:hypothetical protein CDEST_07069 [Colletotrichum destructivum]|uniref:Uncharacterized protein n=1 Tax=Colletotrichum destructivum TaxID=34406 RepID=A0AAX4IFF4_9PEZI|nr:hypothetical protein CDEST_07069 [Colletotrichum destructivum]